MKILVKSLIVWCLLLAVPLQGFASATMLFCAPIESPASVALADAAPAPAHDHHAMLAAQHGDHDHQMHAEPKAGHHDGSKCNSCAACCFGASMAPSDAVRLPVEAQHFSAVAVGSGLLPAVELAFPERPPKVSLI